MKRELEGGWFQWITLPMPALLTIQSGINQLRYATLKGIMAAKKKEIRKVTPASIGRAHAAHSECALPAEGERDADDLRFARRSSARSSSSVCVKMRG